jgi:hypothetical protein
MEYLARNLWRKLWHAISQEISNAHDMDETNPEDYLQLLDRTGTGNITMDEIQLALRNHLGVSIDRREQTFAQFIHDYADTTGIGKITLVDLQHFVEELSYDGDDYGDISFSSSCWGGESLLPETNDNKDDEAKAVVRDNGETPPAPDVDSLTDSETEIEDSDSDFGAGVGAAANTIETM